MKAKRLFILMILVLASSLAMGQDVDNLHQVFGPITAVHPRGLLHHYRMEASGRRPEIDYWLYHPEEGVVQTLFDASSIDGSGYQLASYELDYEQWEFSRMHSQILGTLGPGQWRTRSYQRDRENHSLRIALSFEESAPRETLVYREDIHYSPTVRQDDWGLYFSLFFRHLNPEALPFSLVYDAFGHPIFMKVSYEGEEVVNGIPSLKYRVFGEGLWSALVGQGGYVWISKDDEFPRMVKHSMKIGLSWNMRRLEMNLVGSRQISPEEWREMGERALVH